MNIVFLCLGSRGDVQPYVAIGKTAKESGHNVAICTGKTFKEFVEKNGLVYKDCSLDFMEILNTEEGRQVFEEGLKHPIKAFKYARRVVNPLFRKAMSEFYMACKNMDIVIYHPKAFGATDIAEKLGIPCISMPPIPIIYPVSTFPNLALTTKNLGSFLNKLTYKLTNTGAESNNIKDINHFRVNELQLKKRRSGEYMINMNGNPIPIVYPISPSLFINVEEFKNKVALTGFPVLNTSDTLDEKTIEFLNNGKEPIVVTFSSMPLKNPKIFLNKIIDSILESRNRGIIITGNSGIDMVSVNDNILFKEFLPHDKIFSHSKGILHHGGVGTMAAALRSGKPQAIMPFNVDQPFWAKKLYESGYSLRPLKESDPKNQFIDTFREMDNEKVIEMAEKISRILNNENANIEAVIYIEKIYKEWNGKNE